MTTSEKVLKWAEERGLDNENNYQAQLIKLMEELGELSGAILKGKREEELDAFGDVLVVLEILAKQRGVNLITEYEKAYRVIENRTGKMVNGSFVKDEH